MNLGRLRQGGEADLLLHEEEVGAVTVVQPAQRGWGEEIQVVYSNGKLAMFEGPG